MSDIAELTTDGKLQLPLALAQRFRPTDRFLVWADGDTVHLKRITPIRVTEAVAQALQGEPMSPEEVSEEVHAYRREKRGG